MNTLTDIGDEIRKPENQIDIFRRLSAYSALLRGETNQTELEKKAKRGQVSPFLLSMASSGKGIG
jgi:hypothetical protein